MAECSGNLVSDNLMASPVAETAFKTTALKVIMVCVSTCLDQFPQPQAVLMFMSPCLSAYLQIESVSCPRCTHTGRCPQQSLEAAHCICNKLRGAVNPDESVCCARPPAGLQQAGQELTQPACSWWLRRCSKITAAPAPR
jgi:hypothetical protein